MLTLCSLNFRLSRYFYTVTWSLEWKLHNLSVSLYLPPTHTSDTTPHRMHTQCTYAYTGFNTFRSLFLTLTKIFVFYFNLKTLDKARNHFWENWDYLTGRKKEKVDLKEFSNEQAMVRSKQDWHMCELVRPWGLPLYGVLFRGCHAAQCASKCVVIEL